MDGFTLATKIRETDAHTPILFLTAKSLKEDRIQGLTLGGDDYLTKPFSIEELILKIKIFLRRSQVNSNSTQPAQVRLGKYTLHTEQLLLYYLNKPPCGLTHREVQLLAYLAKYRNQVLKREAILQHLWHNNDYFAGRSLDVFISRLRKYLQSESDVKIENIHSVGFRLVVPD